MGSGRPSQNTGRKLPGAAPVENLGQEAAGSKSYEGERGSSSHGCRYSAVPDEACTGKVGFEFTLERR